MPGLTLIQQLPDVRELKEQVRIRLQADRATLAKRRWRGMARDGREFGFDLDHPIGDGTPFHIEDGAYYVLEQLPEEILEIPVAEIKDATRMAWNLGNLHFPVEVLTQAIHVAPDPAVLQFLARENISFRKIDAVFQPLAAGAHHHA